MKKLLSILIILLLVGCVEEKPVLIEDDVKIKESLEFEFASKVYSNELFESEVDFENKLLDTYTLGEHKIKIGDYSITYNVIDNTPPVINVSNMTTLKGKEISFLDKMMCGDNYDKSVKCEIVGDYNFDEVGEYLLKVVATDSSNNKLEKEFKLKVVEKNEYGSNPSYYYFDDLISKYKKENTLVGIDVSSWQGDINFKKVKDAGCDFVMIRMAYGHKNGEIIYDSKFKQNLKNAKENGLQVGLYFYSYAKSIDEAKDQAEWIVKELNGEKLDLPIAFDWEIWNGFNSYNLNFYELNNIANAFIDELNKNNYKGIIYGSAFFINRVWDPVEKPWLAYYTKENDFEKPYMMWQLSSTGKIDGINGYVDLDILYK